MAWGRLAGDDVTIQNLRELDSRSAAQDHGNGSQSGPPTPYSGMYGCSATGIRVFCQFANVEAALARRPMLRENRGK